MEKKKEMKHLVMKMNEMNISNEDIKDDKKDEMMELKKEKEKDKNKAFSNENE